VSASKAIWSCRLYSDRYSFVTSDPCVASVYSVEPT
jgi:hypothetical protein